MLLVLGFVIINVICDIIVGDFLFGIIKVVEVVFVVILIVVGIGVVLSFFMNLLGKIIK